MTATLHNDRLIIAMNPAAELYSGHLLSGAPYEPVRQPQLQALPTAKTELSLGSFMDIPVFLQVVEPEVLVASGPQWRNFRAVLLESNSEMFSLLSAARQVMEWYREHQFCGVCGASTQIVVNLNDRFLECSSCQYAWYPRISPCMICVVVKDDSILLAQHKRSATGYYSALAGFVEPGESVEQALHREVMEEVGLEVTGLHYVGTQAWSFPHQLMIGYICHYAAGEITLCDEEIADARWFHYDALPNVPPSKSLSGQLIETAVSRLRHLNTT